jgi:hypothetical protein
VIKVESLAIDAGSTHLVFTPSTDRFTLRRSVLTLVLWGIYITQTNRHYFHASACCSHPQRLRTSAGALKYRPPITPCLSTTSLISFTSASDRDNFTAEAFSTVLDAFLLHFLSELFCMFKNGPLTKNQEAG